MNNTESSYNKQKAQRDAWISENSASFIIANDSLVINSEQTQTFIQKVESLKGDKYDMLTDYRENEYEFVSRAAHSENSAITYQETFEILNGRTEGIAPEKVAVVRGIVKAREIVVSAVIDNTKVDLNLLRSINREIESGISYEAGLIRGERPDKSGLGTFVSLGAKLSFVPPEPGVQGSLLVERFNSIMEKCTCSFDEIVLVCAKLTYAQIFYNGNKRTSREFANVLLLQNGYPCISVDDEEEYLSAVTKMDKTGDATELIVYFSEGIIRRHSK